MNEKNGVYMIPYLLLSALVIVLLIIFDKQIQQQALKHSWVRILKYSLVVLMAVFAILSIVFAVGEVTANDLSGLSHLIPLIPLSIIAFLLLKEPGAE